MSPPPLQPPGWYFAQGDPPATNRWWDGTQWVGGPVASGGFGPFGEAYPFAVPFGGRPVYAGFWERFGALLLDNLILGVPLVVFAVIFFNAAPTTVEACTVDGREGLCDVPTGGAFGLFFAVIAAAVIGWAVLYHGRLEGRTGQTLGKRAVGIKTVRVQTGQPLGTGRAIGRFVAHWPSGFLCYLGYFWMLWDGQKQTWHDKMTDAVVVKVDH
jgi:uncharacterized RDD family membrane protein YckC